MNLKSMSFNIQILIARIFIASMFVVSGIGKIISFSSQTQFVNSSWIMNIIPFLAAEVVLVIAIMMQLIGATLILTGWNMKYGAYILMLFTFLALLMFYIEDLEIANILKNLSVIGGLLVLSMMHAGKFSLDEEEN
ncbi:MAG: DoxX family protein [Candidatus Woesearchaeota archaeon]